jgi:hypothetical protein
MKTNTIDPRDEQWVRERMGRKFDDDGVCFAFWRGAQMGPFSCWAEANAALDKAMRDAGVEIAPGVDCGSVVFADPVIYHPARSGGKLDG